MLLYDQVLEHAERELRRRGPDEFGYLNTGLLDYLKRCVVYELSNLVPLFPDWQKGKDQAIPKTPPHPLTWAEWNYRDTSMGGGSWEDFTIGVMIFGRISPAEIKASITSDHFVKQDDFSVDRFAGQGKDYYVLKMFKRCDGGGPSPKLVEEAKANGRVLQRTVPLKVPLGDFGTFFWAHNSNGTAAECYKAHLAMRKDEDFEDYVKKIQPFHMRTVASPEEYLDEDPNWHLANPWPPFMAFSLLHCKNVVTEETVPDAKIQHQCRKHGRPPRVTYKTLKIEVPRSVQNRQAYMGGSEDAGPKVRFHLCSGHFKNLQHERYKEKGWHWWPAHWKGAKELGEVHKTYKLEPGKG